MYTKLPHTLFHNTEIKVKGLGTICSKQLTFLRTVHYTRVMKTDDSVVGMLRHFPLQVFTNIELLLCTSDQWLKQT